MIRVLPMAASLALMMGLYLISTLPADPVPPSPPQAPAPWISWSLLSNLAHVPAYLLLAWTLFFSVNGAGSARGAAGISFGIAVAYGVLLELAQAGVPGRYASLGDVGLNSLGAAAGVMLAARYAARKAWRTDESGGQEDAAQG